MAEGRVVPLCPDAAPPRHHHEHLPIWRSNAPQFAHQLFCVSHMLQRMDGDGQVDRRVGERHLQGIAKHRVRGALAGPGGSALPRWHEGEHPFRPPESEPEIGRGKAQAQ